LKKQAFCSQEVEEKKKIKIMKKERASRMKIEVTQNIKERRGLVPKKIDGRSFVSEI
jgi:hypothetical protein